jgi:pimeloyl-ACP methyl ester carboxylesterase
MNKGCEELDPQSRAVASWMLFLKLAAALGLVALSGTGCIFPIGARPASSSEVWRQTEMSPPPVQLQSNCTAAAVLERSGMVARFQKSPAETLSALHQQALTTPDGDLLLALAELNYIHGDRLSHKTRPWDPGRPEEYFLASAIYSYLWLFGEAAKPRTPIDPASRPVCILHNQALERALSNSQSAQGEAVFEGGTRSLPFGKVTLTLENHSSSGAPAGSERFLFANRYLIRGVKDRNRQEGIGVPLISVAKKSSENQLPFCAPVTARLQIEGDLASLSSDSARGALVLDSPYLTPEVQLNGHRVPLEADLSAPLAYTLNDSFIWNLGREQFLLSKEQVKDDIYLSQPYQPGRIPVLLVHGTLSTPAYWGELCNTLQSDSELRRRFQFWNFVYNSAHPVGLSAARLRISLTNLIQSLDPKGLDPALREMVIIGHSQGGLLAKLMITDTEDKLWRANHDRALEEASLTPAQREIARQLFFFKPLPEVRRAIFIATPHRGSNLAGLFSRSLTDLIVSTPKGDVLDQGDSAASGPTSDRRLPKDILPGGPNSVSGMAPDNPWLLTLAAIPPDPGVKTHSIIAVTGSGDPHKGGDGSVRYSSAHVDYAESELVVRSNHRCLDNPEMMKEVARILHEHLQAMPAAVVN